MHFAWSVRKWRTHTLLKGKNNQNLLRQLKALDFVAFHLLSYNNSVFEWTQNSKAKTLRKCVLPFQISCMWRTMCIQLVIQAPNSMPWFCLIFVYHWFYERMLFNGLKGEQSKTMGVQDCLVCMINVVEYLESMGFRLSGITLSPLLNEIIIVWHNMCIC